jgi:hypothetical protein
MSNKEWLHARGQEITPTASDKSQLQSTLAVVSAKLSQEVSVAQIRPCGSAAKGTMLRGRNEGDLVLLMREAPTPQTLERFRHELSRLPQVESAEILYKAVATKFKNGTSVDVLPAAQDGLTEPGGSIPSKHRHAADGPNHVRWFQQAGYETGAPEIVRLTKSWRNEHGLSKLSSFGLEVLTVDVLRELGSGSLDHRFHAVLERLASGEFAVNDPVRSSNWINQLAPHEVQRVMQAAKESLAYMQKGQMSHAFAGTSYPGSVRGLSGTPLA